MAGVTRYLTEKSNGRVQGWLADPPGSVLYHVVENGKAQREGNGSITEGEWGLGMGMGVGGGVFVCRRWCGG